MIRHFKSIPVTFEEFVLVSISDFFSNVWPKDVKISYFYYFSPIKLLMVIFLYMVSPIDFDTFGVIASCSIIFCLISCSNKLIGERIVFCEFECVFCLHVYRSFVLLIDSRTTQDLCTRLPLFNGWVRERWCC